MTTQCSFSKFVKIPILLFWTKTERNKPLPTGSILANFLYNNNYIILQIPALKHYYMCLDQSVLKRLPYSVTNYASMENIDDDYR